MQTVSHELLKPHHLLRKAVIYIRQSTGHQVLSNLESQKLQLAMKEHALRLGFAEASIVIVESDTGISANSTAGRRGYKELLAQVALGEVGIILSYESTRLSRNCSDWYPLLDLCALNSCLIADRDGVYDPSCANGRLLLGMKGILSEVELHTLRGRLLAGVVQKAQRGELALALPAGLLRLENGAVVKDPDLQIQELIALIFSTFLSLRSAAQVVRHFRRHSLRVPRRHRNDATVLRPPALSSVVAILRNPAYAGAFVYGKTRSVRSTDPQRARPHQRRRPQSQWRVLVKDRYPAYICWDTFERIQAMLADNHAEYDRNKTRGVPRDGAALLQGLCYCGECGHKMVVQYKGGSRYLCNFVHQQTQGPICQYLPADPIDRYVVDAFFAALSPIELDLYEAAQTQRQQQQTEVRLAQQRQLQRLRYEVELARRQYDRVDPDNRLVASELERRWEVALHTLQQTEQRYQQDDKQMQSQTEPLIPAELRAAFQNVGQALPQLWTSPTLSRSMRKALLRCLIDKVVLRRLTPRERVLLRIVWRGGVYTETELAVPVHALRDLSSYDDLEAEILKMQAEGQSDEQIAESLSARGFRSPQHDTLLPSTVKGIRLKHRRFHRFSGPRPRRVPGFLTLPQIAEELGVTAHWLYHLIDRGVIKVDRDVKTRLYLFPDHPDTLAHLCQLRDQLVKPVSNRQGHQDA